MDYSENIALTKKRQMQSAYFSGKQQTLNNMIIRCPGIGENIYVYQLSDDTNHVSVMTFHVIFSNTQKV